MPIKTLLILLSLISYPSVAGAEQIHWQKYSLMHGQYQIAQDADELFRPPEPKSYPSPATQTTPIGYIDHKPINPSAAFFYVLLPGIPLIPPLTLGGLITVTFLTIPAHVYVHDSFTKIIVITAIKTVSIATATIAVVAAVGGGLGCMGADTDCETDDTSGAAALAILGVVGFLGTYIYELIDVPYSAAKFNEKIKPQEVFYIAPYAYKDQYRLNVGYRF